MTVTVTRQQTNNQKNSTTVIQHFWFIFTVFFFQKYVTCVFSLDDESIGRIPQILTGQEIREILVLFVHGIVHGQRYPHVSPCALSWSTRGRYGRSHDVITPSCQFAAAVSRGLATHGAYRAGWGRCRR